MILGVNVIRLTRKFTGVGRYLECVLREWSGMELPFERVLLYTHTLLRQEHVAFPLERFEQRVIGRVVPDPLWEAVWLRQAAKEVDVLYCPSYSIPWAYPGRCAVTYLGPSEFRFGGYAWWRAQAYETLFRYSARRADRVFAISRAVRNRLVQDFRIPDDRIDLTYLAASDLFRPLGNCLDVEQRRRKYIPGDEPFILFVGKLAKRHSIPNLLAAFAELKHDSRLPHRLVLVGPDYLHLDIPARARRLGIANCVTHIPYVYHADLPPLYNAAEFFVYPATEAEGFGIPVVEAMACGTPVVTVNQGSLREIAPGAALTTEASGVDDLREAMVRMATDAELRRELSTRGIERAKSFQWRITAERTLDVLARLATPSPVHERFASKAA